MGMSIDDAVLILSCETLDSSMGCGASYEDIDNALGVAIDTMHRYQKIEDIYYHQTGRALEDSLREVIEDGKID